MTAEPPNDSLQVGRLVITYEIDPDGGMSTTYESDGEPLSLVVVLGLLRLAEDTAIREAMRDG